MARKAYTIASPNRSMEEKIPVAAWTEIQIDGDSISLSLISEGRYGTRVEDTERFTFDELQEKAGDIESLRLSEDSRERLSDAFERLEELQESENLMQKPKRQTPEIKEGLQMVDKSPPEWSDNPLVEVTDVEHIRADCRTINDGGPFSDTTVADENPDYPASDRVIVAKYVMGSNKRYAFPESRLRHLKDVKGTVGSSDMLYEKP